ncbi:MAG: hypothetical protein GY950_10900 [bacterium]|nr:hypothetical protein [bacterium]
MTNGAPFAFAASESVTNGAPIGADPSGFGSKMSHFDLTPDEFVSKLHLLVPEEAGSTAK